jgi:hypothetical protein
MHTGSESESSMHEFVTGILDESSWPEILAVIVGFLRDRKVESVTVEFGFIFERDLRGEAIPESSQVPLTGLRAFIERGLCEGTIVWGDGDFQFSSVGLPLHLMLCNDSDLHLFSPDSSLLLDLSQRLMARGVEVYNSGKLIKPDQRS